MSVINGHRDDTVEKPWRVGVVPLDGFAMMSFSAAVEPLRAANRLAEKTLYEIQYIGNESVVTSSAGATVPTDLSIGTGEPFQLILVIAGSDVRGEVLFHYSNTALFQWLRFASEQGALLGGVSGGPVMLAKAGLMNNRRMTVHWNHAEELRSTMPSLLVERSLYIRDRDRLTCAGGTAPLDMMHALIREHHGHDFAQRVSDWFLHTEIRESKEPQRARFERRLNADNTTPLRAPLIDVIELMENHVADPLDLNQLARVAGMSVRQLNRVFNDELNQSTIAYYRRLRLHKAHTMLERSALSIGDVAEATGFFDSAHFGRCFKHEFGCSPKGIRAGVSV